MENITDEELKELARKKKNEYQRNWYKRKMAKGIDKRAEYNRRYWKRKALEELKKEDKNEKSD